MNDAQSVGFCLRKRPEKMSSREACDQLPCRECHAFVPVKLDDAFRGITPVFEVFAYAERADDAADAFFQGFDSGIVEVVVVVMGNDEVVDRRDIVGSVDVGAFEGLHHQRCGISGCQDRVDKECGAAVDEQV